MTKPIPAADAVAHAGWGRHAPSYRSEMRRLLSALAATDSRILGRFAARSMDDPAIALLDGWATIADVLGFYQHQIALEGFLATASEDRSILELTRLIGYVPRPGLAASVHLAYQVDPLADLDSDVPIPSGSRVKSVPAPGGTAQAFETSKDLTARARWNTLPVRTTEPVAIGPETEWIYLAGPATTLKANDVVAIAPTNDTPYLGRRILATRLDIRTNLIGVRLRRPDDPASAALAPQEDHIAKVEPPTVTPNKDSTTVLDEATQALRQARLLSLPSTAQPGIATASVQIPSGPAALASATAPGTAADATATPGRVVEVLTAMHPHLGPRIGVVWSANAVPTTAVPTTAMPATAVPAEANATGTGSAAPTPLVVLNTPAAIFGTTAPGKFVITKGVIQGVDDWPRDDLTQLLRFGLSVRISAGATPRIWVTRAIGNQRTTHEMHWSSAGWQLDYSVNLAPMTVTYEPHSPVDAANATMSTGRYFPALFIFAEGTLSCAIRIDLTASSDAVDVSVDGCCPTTVQLDLSSEQRLLARRKVVTISTIHTVAANLKSRTAQATRSSTTVAVEATPPATTLILDTLNPRVAPGSLVAVVHPGIDEISICKVKRVDTATARAYGVVRQVTKLSFDAANAWPSPPEASLDSLRAITVWLEGSRMPRAEGPITEPLAGDTITLDGLLIGIDAGKLLAVSGPAELIDANGAPTAGPVVGEIVTVASVAFMTPPPESANRSQTHLTLTQPLTRSYQRDTVTVAGNVVPATQGTTHDDPIGNGDARRALATFPLPQSPLTWLPDTTRAGISAEPQLEITVDDVVWRRAPSWAQLKPAGKQYLLSSEPIGSTSIVFGDGFHGARPSTGIANVRATYRTGLGRSGNVAAGSISQIQSRPLGVRAVSNPVAASGGADPESGNQIRRRATAGLVSLGRLVSGQDYADFALAYGGIGKASVRTIDDIEGRTIQVVVAGPTAEKLAAGSALIQALAASLVSLSGNPDESVVVQPCSLYYAVVDAGLRIAADHRMETVRPAVFAALTAAFGYEPRNLGEPLCREDLIKVIQGVAGVDVVVLKELRRIAQGASPSDIQAVLTAQLAARQPERVPLQPSDLIVVDPGIPHTILLEELP